MIKVLILLAAAVLLLAGCAQSEAERKADQDCRDLAKSLRVAGMVDDAGEAYEACYPKRLEFYRDQENS